MYTVTDIVEIGKAQSLILSFGKWMDIFNVDDIWPLSSTEPPDFDE